MIDSPVKQTAKRVINIEKCALAKMEKNIPDDFVDAVFRILVIPGRVIVSGVGKSGHVGNKIAATLASTGTPSSFVHPTEASHGDLGMITASDFCLLISNSGETKELDDIVAHAKRFEIPLAVISSKRDSTLIRSADFKLILPEVDEACSIGMAPTTSTTMALAFGDALAVSLMEHRQFTLNDFKVFHPGGKLGAQLLTVDNLMRSSDEIAILDQGCSMRDVILKMTETGFGMSVLVDENQDIIGVISDGDIRRNIENLMSMDPKRIASCNPVTVEREESISVALKKMQDNKVYVLLVLDGSRPAGMLRMHDLLKAGVA